VLRGVWRELMAVARALGLAAVDDAYDPEIYRAVYERLLARRHAEALSVDERLPTATVRSTCCRARTRRRASSRRSSATTPIQRRSSGRSRVGSTPDTLSAGGRP